MKILNEENGINDIVRRVKGGESAAFAMLSDKYRPLVVSICKKYYTDSNGIDVTEDIIQECMIVLYHAAMTYDPENKKVTFGLYSKICLRNHVISELRKISSSRRRRDMSETQVEQIGVEDRYFKKEAKERLEEKLIPVLSDYEKKVCHLFIEGMKPSDIAKQEGTDPKSVSNAIFRIKTKAKSIY